MSSSSHKKKISENQYDLHSHPTLWIQAPDSPDPQLFESHWTLDSFSILERSSHLEINSLGNRRTSHLSADNWPTNETRPSRTASFYTTPKSTHNPWASSASSRARLLRVRAQRLFSSLGSLGRKMSESREPLPCISPRFSSVKRSKIRKKVSNSSLVNYANDLTTKNSSTTVCSTTKPNYVTQTKVRTSFSNRYSRDKSQDKNPFALLRSGRGRVNRSCEVNVPIRQQLSIKSNSSNNDWAMFGLFGVPFKFPSQLPSSEFNNVHQSYECIEMQGLHCLPLSSESPLYRRSVLKNSFTMHVGDQHIR